VIATVIAASALLLFQTAKGSIEGVVTDHVTGKPIAHAQVAGTKLPDPEVITDQAPAKDTASFVQSVEIAPVMSDANGRFVVRDLNPGNYFLRASAEGYVQEDYRLLSGAVSAEVKLSSCQAVKDVVFRLVPGGTIGGRVTGSNGEPLVNIEVTLLHRRYHPDGRKTFEVSGRATTNDRGEYRIFWITPGSYYLSAGSSNRPIPGVPFNAATVRNKYPRTFYPVTTDIATATTIDIPPAVELTGLDFRLTLKTLTASAAE
jgi:Carboxypeptidase regulatory-like domain